MKTEEILDLAKQATRHVLNAICDDPRKYWLLGNGTGSWEKLTAAHAALWGTAVDDVRRQFTPNPRRYEQYCDEKESAEELLEFLREKGITTKDEAREALGR